MENSHIHCLLSGHRAKLQGGCCVFKVNPNYGGGGRGGGEGGKGEGVEGVGEGREGRKGSGERRGREERGGYIGEVNSIRIIYYHHHCTYVVQESLTLELAQYKSTCSRYVLTVICLSCQPYGVS